MSSEADRHHLVVIDDNRMRQAGIVSLISDWADQADLEIREISASQVLKALENSAGCRLVLFSIGGRSVRSDVARGLMRIVHALAPEAPVVVISDRDEPAEIIGAYEADCSGYIPTSMEPALALQAIGFVLDGGSYFPPSALRLVAESEVPDDGEENNGEDEDDPSTSGDGTGGAHLSDADDEPGSALLAPGASGDGDDPCSLTGRQYQVLKCLQKGQPNKLIARELGMTEGTVKVHVRQIMRKLGATNRTQVAILATTTRSVAVRVQARATARGSRLPH